MGILTENRLKNDFGAIDFDQTKFFKKSIYKYKRNAGDMGQNDDDPIPYESNLLDDENALNQILKMDDYEPENLPNAQKLYFYIEKIQPRMSNLSLVNLYRPEPGMIAEINRMRLLVLLKAELKRLETIVRLQVLDYRVVRNVLKNLHSPKKEFYLAWYADMMSKDYKYESVVRNLRDIYILLNNMQVEHKNLNPPTQEFH
ncbi:hypothetical protein COBT_001922 [Conglomerata obtusa]